MYYVKRECPFAKNLTQQQIKDIVLTKNQELLDELLDTGNCILPGLGKLFVIKYFTSAVDKEATYIKKQGYTKDNPNPVRYVEKNIFRVVWQKHCLGQKLTYNRFYRFVLNKNVKKMIKDRVNNNSLAYFDKSILYDTD